MKTRKPFKKELAKRHVASNTQESKEATNNTLLQLWTFAIVFWNYLLKTLRRNRDIYPLMVFAFAPVFIFWKGNNLDQLTLPLMFRILVFVLILTLIIFLFFYFIFGRNKFKASILGILTVSLIFYYGELYNLYESLTSYLFGSTNVITTKYGFLWFILIVLVGASILVHRKLSYSKPIRDYLVIVATVLLVFNVFPIVKHELTKLGLDSFTYGSPIRTNIQEESNPRPDIYYLVFDRYASDSTLKNVYNYDNSNFTDYLKNKNFYLASDSAANYPETALSLPSSLNLDYLPGEFNDRSKNNLPASMLHHKIEDNRVVTSLKSNGYSFTNIGPWWNPSKYNDNADNNLITPEGIVLFNKSIDFKQHEHIIFKRTIFYRFTRKPVKIGGFTILERTYPNNDTAGRAVHKQTAFKQFEYLKKTTKTDGPKYVFAHFLMPHDPYVVDKNCNHMPRNDDDENENYIRQLECTNTKIKETVDYILQNNSTNPIIVIQADEGPYPEEYRVNEDIDWTTAPPRVLQQKSRIINAYYFPDNDHSVLYPSISPVNSFRVIFNQYLGAELSLLEDKQYFWGPKDTKAYTVDLTEKFRSIYPED